MKRKCDADGRPQRMVWEPPSTALLKKCRPLGDRFWAKVERRGPNECWPWTGATTSNGYGSMTRGRRAEKRTSASRVSWELHFGPIAKGLLVCHHCDNPPCVNPAHLFLGTKSDNARDSVRKGRHRTLRGERCWRAKLTSADVAAIRESGESHAALGRRFGVVPQAIMYARTRRTWKHVP
jgi:hypothetical protein